MSASLTLSPFVEFVEDHTSAEGIRFGVFHRLTGQAICFDHVIKDILERLRTDPIHLNELNQLSAEAVQLFEGLEQAHFLVGSTEPRELIRSFLDWRLLVPACNPALMFAKSDEERVVIRLRNSHQCRLPRLSFTPEIEEEPVSKTAARLFDAALGNALLREIINCYQGERIREEL